MWSEGKCSWLCSFWVSLLLRVSIYAKSTTIRDNCSSRRFSKVDISASFSFKSSISLPMPLFRWLRRSIYCPRIRFYISIRSYLFYDGVSLSFEFLDNVLKFLEFSMDIPQSVLWFGVFISGMLILLQQTIVLILEVEVIFTQPLFFIYLNILIVIHFSANSIEIYILAAQTLL